MIALKKTLIVCLFLFTAGAFAATEISKEQLYTLYNQANEAFRQANSMKDSGQAERLYEKAILNFEKIIDQGHIENAKLYYNLANAYLLTGRLGKAILNYRKAEKMDDSDGDIQKNLAFARSKRVDKIPLKTEKRVLKTLFFWHYDFPLKTKFLFTCILFGLICVFIIVAIWLGRNNALTISAIICAALMICFLSSVIIDHKTHTGRISGVITVKEAVARQGDGQNYPSSFKEPLHEGTEFDLLEKRPDWYHIKLSDDSDGWIPEDSAELI
jgi:tetratricopeptide (TPR) repeat protein